MAEQLTLHAPQRAFVVKLTHTPPQHRHQNSRCRSGRNEHPDR